MITISRRTTAFTISYIYEVTNFVLDRILIAAWGDVFGTSLDCPCVIAGIHTFTALAFVTFESKSCKIKKWRLFFFFAFCFASFLFVGVVIWDVLREILRSNWQFLNSLLDFPAEKTLFKISRAFSWSQSDHKESQPPKSLLACLAESSSFEYGFKDLLPRH